MQSPGARSVPALLQATVGRPWLSELHSSWRSGRELYWRPGLSREGGRARLREAAEEEAGGSGGEEAVQ